MISNIGYVVYSKEENDNLSAVWSFFTKKMNVEGKEESLLLHGTGNAIPIGKIDGFVGEYTITYKVKICPNSEDMEDSILHLKIALTDCTSEIYTLEWSAVEDNNRVTIVGTGAVVDGKLSAGWRHLWLDL